MSTVVVRAYDHGRAEKLGTMAERIWALLTSLGAVHPKLSAWHARAADGSLSALEGFRDCLEAIERRKYTWRSGEQENVAFGPVIVAGAAAPWAELGLVCGMEPSPVWMPNQVVLRPSEALLLDAKDPGPYHAILGAVAQSWAPAWGHVSVDGVPAAPVPPFTNGTPVVGWITYLSSAYPVAPAVLPKPSVAYGAEKGTVFVAHPRGADRAAIAALAASLKDAGVLLPAMEVKARAGAVPGFTGGLPWG